MIRVYVTAWSIVDLGLGHKRVINPIIEYAETNNINCQCNMYYPDTDADGLPDKPRVLVLVKSDAELTAFEALAGVTKITPYPFGTLSDDIPDSVKTELAVLAETNGIPWTVIQGSPTYGDALKRLAGFLSTSFVSFGSLESEDFS